MTTPATEYSLAELMICANASAYDNDGEVLVTGIGVLPRIAASLAMLSSNTDIMMTDSEAWLLSEPNPVGKRDADFQPKAETWMGFTRIFDNVWSGRRHLTGGPTQIDRFAQANISALGGDHSKPKVQMLGVRGFPGNSICHANSYLVPMHSKRVFVEGECRGIAERMYFPFDDRYMYIVQVYSNVDSGEELTFKYYDSLHDKVIEYSETLTFENYMNVGDGFNTFSLSREVGDLQQPIAYGISDAYPNPFNPVTSFEYTLEKDGMVQVAVYDLNGRMVSELVNGYQSAGSYPVVWDAQELSSGVYMVNMISGDYSTVQKVMLIK